MSTFSKRWVEKKEAAKALGWKTEKLNRYIREGALLCRNGLIPWDAFIKFGKQMCPELNWDVDFGVKNRRGELVVTPPIGAIEDIILDLETRLRALENLGGVAGRHLGLNRIFLQGLLETVSNLDWDSSPFATFESRERWVHAIEQFDYETVRTCLDSPRLRELLNWLLRAAQRMHEVSRDPVERARIRSTSNNLRYLCAQAAPPGPVVLTTFKMRPELSPFESFLFATHFRPIN